MDVDKTDQVIDSRIPFACVPNSFAQNPSISVEAKGTALFLQSLPSGWKIHPDWIQKQLGYGRKVWLRIAKELIGLGYLKRFQGGVNAGTCYIFSLWNYQNNLFKSESSKKASSTPKSESSFLATSPKSDSPFLAPLINKHKQIKKQLYKKTTTTPLACGAVDDLKKIKISEKKSQELVAKHGEEKILSAIKHIKSQPKLTNPAGYLIKMLDDGWEPQTPKNDYPIPGPEETKAQLSQMKGARRLDPKKEIETLRGKLKKAQSANI